MTTTVSVQDDLLSRAQESAGIRDTDQLVAAALQALIEKNAYESLIEFAGAAPDMEDIPRRRPSA